MLLVACTSFVSAADLKITISENLPPPITYSQEVKAMSDAEFFTWATEQNATAKAASEAKSKLDQEYWPGNIVRVNTIVDRHWRETTVEDRPTLYRNPLYTGPGPLTVINPYCRFKDDK
jgi:hypothetical protein